MLSLVLPILALAIALTPVVVSARNTYMREVDEQVHHSDPNEVGATKRSKAQQRDPVGTNV